MQFQVPQFIEIEDKIFGSLTFKQFVYVAGGAAGGFVISNALPHIVGYPLGLAFVLFGLGLAFYKINDRPFITTVEASFRYAFGGKKFSWQRIPRAPKSAVDIAKAATGTPQLPSMSQSKLKDLAWALDIQDKVNQK